MSEHDDGAAAEARAAQLGLFGPAELDEEPAAAPEAHQAAHSATEGDSLVPTGAAPRVPALGVLDTLRQEIVALELAFTPWTDVPQTVEHWDRHLTLLRWYEQIERAQRAGGT